MNIKNIIKYLLPPFIVDLLRLVVFSRYWWHGDYKSWEEAKRLSSGYDAPQILEKVRNALLKVKKGEAVHERDSVLFHQIEYSWPLLSGVLLAAAFTNGRLSVLDFGGSLGSSYFQNRKFLSLLCDLSWNIIEQKHFVDEGKKYFEDDRLHFYYDIKECVEKENPNVLLLSGVLQVLENPYNTLEDLLSYNFPFVIIDRTPFHTKARDRITIQRVPPWIYEASYPCWIFNKKNFLSFFENKGYRLIESFESLDGKTKDFEFMGHIFFRE